MRAAVLCPGPSLSKLTEAPRADVTIGVNRAVLRFRCDWWSVCDVESFAEIDPDYTPHLFTMRATVERAPRFGCYDRLMRHVLLHYEDEGIHASRKLGWAMFSATAAMVLAYQLGARQINVYGADMCGEADYDGLRPPRCNRDEARWRTEREIVARVDHWLREHGATLNHGPV